MFYFLWKTTNHPNHNKVIKENPKYSTYQISDSQYCLTMNKENATFKQKAEFPPSTHDEIIAKFT